MAGRCSRRQGVLGGPQCLLQTLPSGQLSVNREVADQLSTLDKPCVVVAIAGPYRTGKSYIMNRLAGHSSGFPLGSTIQSKTKGIWVWVVDHPYKPDLSLILLDTEGLGDAEKGDIHHDNIIFSLAALLSSMLIYNIFGVIEEDSLNKLHFITEMSKHITTKSAGHHEDDADFDWYFPIFVFALRDFYLEKTIDGREVSSNEYLEHLLKLKEGEDDRTKRYNGPRLCIRKYFTQRYCFTFDRPGDGRTLRELEELPDGRLSEDFVREMNEFTDFIYRKAPVKKLDTGKEINGRMLAGLAEAYADTINSGQVLCIESAVSRMAAVENRRAVEEALGQYRQLMEEHVDIPTQDEDAITCAHAVALQQAVRHFLQTAVVDSKHEFLEDLNKAIMADLEQRRASNEVVSEIRCRDLLEQLASDLQVKVREGEYAKAGGYAEFQGDLMQLQQHYESQRNLGVKSSSVLLSFLDNMNSMGQTIMAADMQVTEAERREETSRQEALLTAQQMEQIEREAELERRHAEELARALEDNRSLVEQTVQQERRQLKEHYDRVLEERLREQQRLAQEGAQRQAENFQRQIEELRRNPPVVHRGGSGKRGCIVM